MQTNFLSGIVTGIAQLYVPVIYMSPNNLFQTLYYLESCMEQYVFMIGKHFFEWFHFVHSCWHLISWHCLSSLPLPSFLWLFHLITVYEWHVDVVIKVTHTYSLCKELWCGVTRLICILIRKQKACKTIYTYLYKLQITLSTKWMIQPVIYFMYIFFVILGCPCYMHNFIFVVFCCLFHHCT